MAVLHAGSLTLGSIVLGESDSSGVEWYLNDLKGWSDPPGSSGSTDQRGSADGGWLSPAYSAARVVEVEGSLVASDWAAASLALDRLWAALPVNITAPMVVNEGTRTLQSNVRQEGDPLVERNAGFARFNLSLVAPDPRRYGAATTADTGLPATTGGLILPLVLPLSLAATASSGTLTVTNTGNMESLPMFTVYGPCAPFTISHPATGRQLASLDTVPAGRTLVLDTAARTALLDGVASRVVTGTWLSLPPGTTQIVFNASGYDVLSRLSVTYRSAYR